MINFKQDGITHINIYSKGKTELGQTLSNFSYFPFDCEDGHFKSIEAYWHWLGVPDNCPQKEDLKEIHGYEAKKMGEQLKKKYGQKHIENFEERILAAIRIKMNAFKNSFKSPTGQLPFEHYYVFNNKVFNMKNKYLWLINGMEEIRKEILLKKEIV